MRVLRRNIFAIAAVGAVAAACSDEPTPAPTAPVTPEASRLGVLAAAIRPAWIPAICDINLLKSDARAYTKSNDELQTIIGAMSTEYGKKRFRNATLKAFDGLARIAEIRGTTDQKSDITPAVFNSLVEGFLACMEAEVVENAIEPNPPAPNLGTGFGAALGSNWVFEVRGRTEEDADPADERTKTANPTSWWTLEPPGTSTWQQAIGGALGLERVFIYGYQTRALPLPSGVGSSFDHLTIPRISQEPPPTPPKQDTRPYTLSVEIGFCTDETASASSFLNHDGVFVPLLDDLGCLAPQQILPTSSTVAFGGSRPMMLARRAMDLFAPRPLYAAVFASRIGGSRDYLSPSSVYDLGLLNLGPVGTIADGRNSRAITLVGGDPVTLAVTVGSGTNAPAAPDGTPVTVSIVGNSSEIAFLKDSRDADPTATVTRYVKDGIVSFAGLFVTKAGGTQLGFQIEFDGFASPQIVTSNTFNIQNK